ncbi:FabG-like 3-oxoacyl-(acyl-carrier-protein) reductase [Mycobacterium phage PLot]|uniref:Uncharacterized protein n=1 Tax=Mycobacterium phage PLot TaxID=373411 RepID=Q19Y84_9CAUD|nr:FabG-like 3-oxoacyl-(acyl-carrier-protein) reductase [Mycobacterium phage PLot]ABD58664.1 hypothetical protein PBI_PLOT_65 [Mycobacterium phage PLot]
MSRAWVIGGTSGIGKACAERLGEYMVTASTGLEEWDVRERGGAGRQLIRELGYPTHIVYAAGVNHLDWIGDGTYGHEDVINVNLMGFLRLLDNLVLEGGMGRLREGHDSYRGEYPFGAKPNIVAISSDAAERPLRTSIGYCASKAGLNMAVRVAARELGPHGWRINAVSPGMTAPTGMSDYIDKRVPEVRGWTQIEAAQYEAQQEVVPGRIDPREVAEVVFDVLTGPNHLNGSIITINGGR